MIFRLTLIMFHWISPGLIVILLKCGICLDENPMDGGAW